MTDAAKPQPRTRARKSARAATEPEHAPAPGASPAPGAPHVRAAIDAGDLDDAFVKALEADFHLHGPAAVEAMRREKPTEYVKLIAAVRTKNVKDPIDPLRAMSDAELDRHIEELAHRAGCDIRSRATGG